MMYVNTGTGIDSGLLRLHSTYRHDLQCQASEEGRCLKTAAAFLKGLLAFEGALAPILASMVRCDDDAKLLLDDSENAKCKLQSIHKNLEEFIHFDPEEAGYSLHERFVKMFGE
jgi:inositol hexakisphosphate/diphosphoinositol-pentakisphosphate kinase